MIPKWLVTSLILLVSAAWAVTTILDLAGIGARNPVIHGLFTTVLGFVFMTYREELKRAQKPARKTPDPLDEGKGEGEG